VTGAIDSELSLWGLENAEVKFVAARENTVFKLSLGNRAYALRLHRQGYRTDCELQSELDWMHAVSKGGISVPTPVLSKTGAYLHTVDDIQVDVLSWLPGTPVADTLSTMSAQFRLEFFGALGQTMAKLHTISDAWQKPTTFTRRAWDLDGLVGKQPLWDRFWENPGLTDADAALFQKFRETANHELQRLEPDLDYGLIHADLVPENILTHGSNISVIDFDDGGFGFRMFDLVTALQKFHSDDDFVTLKDALISGYKSCRPIDVSTFDLFLALRMVTYVGWNITRMSEDAGMQRNTRFIDASRRLVLSYLV